MEYDLTKKATEENLRKFAVEIKKISRQIGFKVSARGWAYQLETANLITKADFDKVENLMNKCRKKGILPIDFTEEDVGRAFEGVEVPTEQTPVQYMKEYVQASLDCEEWYTPDWWDGEEYYIQMIVEKVDLKTLFRPVCQKFHIPIATSKGWSSMHQRAIYSRRFKEAEQKGLKCVLLYCGDHDPDGLRISDFLRKNIRDLMFIEWADGETGYNPEDLIIKRFGLDYDFIEENKLTWIDNLITGSKGAIAELQNGKIVQGRTKSGKLHPNFNLPYAQEYLSKYGVRKCEANALIVIPKKSREFVRQAIVNYVGEEAEDRFEEKRQEIRDILDEFREKTGLNEALQKALDMINKEQEEGEE